MQKRRTYKPGARRWRNANFELPESARTLIYGLLDQLDLEDDFATSYLKSEYLSKYCDERLVPAVDRMNNAIDKWLDQEAINRETNIRLRSLDAGYNILPRVTYSSFLRFARRIIANILGPLDDTVVLGSFSGGASTSCRRSSSSPAEKFDGQADATSTVLPYLDIIYREAALLRQCGTFDFYREVEGAILFTVPKKTDIDRCACKEPDINMFLQKGVGQHIRSRLRRFGVNLNDQSVNRRLARLGSLDGSLATLDLSSASDSITIECVRALLPSDWFLYLNDIRSQKVVVREETTVTEMFSSMGNGFTFELESLLFYSLVRATSYFQGISGIISVYGDDVICPSGLFHDVSWVFTKFGFCVNQEKSFHSGPFRESCGGHFYNGSDVTPFYLKREASHLTDVIRVANQLRQWAMSDPARRFSSPTIYKVWLCLAELVPENLWGGCDYGSDTSLVSPCAPNKRLVRLSSAKGLPEKGRYIHWHNTNWNRTNLPESDLGKPLDTESKRCRVRSAPKGASRSVDEFYEELFCTSDSA